LNKDFIAQNITLISLLVLKMESPYDTSENHESVCRDACINQLIFK